MKKVVSLLLSVFMMLSIAACGKEPEEDTTNTFSLAQLTPMEQMIAGKQTIFLYDYEVDETYKNVELFIEVYKNGERLDDLAHMRCALPQNAGKDGKNRGSLAFILGTDYRFSSSVCDADGQVISSWVGDAVQPVGDATTRKEMKLESLTKIDGSAQTIAYLAFGDGEKAQGAFTADVFLNPAANAEQAAAFNRIYLFKCTFS